MPTYAYTARDQQGLVQTGELDASDEDEVINTLQHRGLFITALSLKAQGPAARSVSVKTKYSRRLHTGVNVDDQMILCQQLATLIEAGVPLLKSLEVVAAQIESSRLLSAIEAVRNDVAAGHTFRDALAKHPAVFSNLWLNLVETGEASGHLAESLKQLCRHFELAQHLQNEARTALTYPLFLCAAAVLVLALFVYWLIPKFAGIFATMDGMEMPALTQFVITMSDFARRYILLIIGGFFLLSYLVRSYLKTPPGQWMRDRFLLQIPVFKTLFIYIQLATFSRGLATLLESGVPLLSALEILEHSATNKVYGSGIEQIKESVKSGKTMFEPMAQTGLFPPMTVQMVQVGEEVGELARMVERIARYYEERVSIFISRMTRL